jgi:hypothetical protein
MSNSPHQLLAVSSTVNPASVFVQQCFVQQCFLIGVLRYMRGKGEEHHADFRKGSPS